MTMNDQNMTCEQFGEILPKIIDGGGTPQQMAHLASCDDCATLWADLHYIAAEAAALPADYEPANDLWPGIALQLKSEGVIREQGKSETTVIPFVRPEPRAGFSAKWLMPLAAMLVLGTGTYLAVLNGTIAPPPVAQINQINLVPRTVEDEALLKQVAAQSQEKAARYGKHLDQVNAYIADAKRTVDVNPNDAGADEALRDAYNQKTMVYEVAYSDSGQ